ERAEIDREIEPREHARQQSLVGAAELIADVGRYARLNSAGAECDQPQPDEQPSPRVVECQSQVPQAIVERERQDRAIFAQQTVGDECPEERKEINRRLELM